MLTNDRKWSPLDWTSSDDRVRGGSSISELTCSPTSPTAVFKGNLDIETLGGAGFASQRTTGEDRNWDLSSYDGMILHIEKADEKQYTLTLKDELLPKSPNGREQSTISWEYDFKASKGGEKVSIRWEDFKATYRGKEKKDAKPLDLKHIKRISIMMRRYVHLPLHIPNLFTNWSVSLELSREISLCQLGRFRHSIKVLPPTLTKTTHDRYLYDLTRLLQAMMEAKDGLAGYIDSVIYNESHARNPILQS